MEFTATEVTSQVFNSWKRQWLAKPVLALKPKIPFEDLSEKQKYVVSLVEEHIKKDFDEQIRSQIRCLVTAMAGAGKSELIAHLRYAFERKKQSCPEFEYILASLTGSASYLIRGATIHSSFSIPVYRSANHLINDCDNNHDIAEEEELINRKKDRLSKVSIIVLDEFSLIGQNLLKEIDLQLKRADPRNSDKPFAGKSFLMFGDIYQTLAIADTPLFYPSSKRRNSHLRGVYNMYKSFDKVVVLKKQFRQSGDSEEQDAFRSFLDRLKRRECTTADLEYIRARLKARLSPTELQLFENAIHIYPYRRMVWSHNRNVLHSKFTDSEILCLGNGISSLEIAIGCRVVLQKNLSVNTGLSNGSTGTVRDVVYERSVGNEKGSEVEYIIVEFEQYEGERFVCTPKGRGVPIFRQHDSQYDEETGSYINCKRFPLELGYSMTGHKSQGRNLPRVAVFLGQNQLFVGLDYVMLSRCKRITDICILDENISPSRLLTPAELNSPTSLQKYEEKRLLALQTQCFEN